MAETNFKISDTLIYQLEQSARIERTLAVRFLNEKKEFDLSFNEFVMLDLIHINPDIHQRDLAKLALIGTGNLSRELEKLEGKGLITRTLVVKGKRAVKMLNLTEKGEILFKRVSEAVEKNIREIENIYTTHEYETFKKYLLRLKAKLTESIDMVFE